MTNFVAGISVLQAFLSAIVIFVDTLSHYLLGLRTLTDPKGMLSASVTAFNDEYNRIMEENLKSLNDPTKGAISNQVTNVNGGIHLHNDFKENMQPDRIAFTIVEQFKKISKNPVSSRGGGTFSSIPVGGN